MLIDSHTLKDLEVFEAEDGRHALIRLIDRTKTRGGEAALRRRLLQPKSTAADIASVQSSIRFAQAHMDLFNRIPVQFIVGGFETYYFGPFGAPVDGSGFWAVLEMINLRIDNPANYQRIIFGVANAMSIISAMREILLHTRALTVNGELGELLHQIDAILQKDPVRRIPEGNVERWAFWKILRVDWIVRREGREAIGRLVRLVFEIDAIVAMARATSENGFVLPDVVEGAPQITGEGVFHPFLNSPVANPLRLDQQQRMLFLTGPNMAGKTTYLRACGVAVYLAHLGMGVPARSFRFAPCEALFTAISISDDIHNGVSYFQAEARRARTIAEAVMKTGRVVAIMDEPFKGTNVKDALDASCAYFARLASKAGSNFIIASHLIEAGPILESTGHVECRCFRAREDGAALEFDYRLQAGISDQRLGMRVLQEHGIFAILDDVQPADPPPKRG
jgi:DNA mismatch repair ATPase MutS